MATLLRSPRPHQGRLVSLFLSTEYHYAEIPLLYFICFFYYNNCYLIFYCANFGKIKLILPATVNKGSKTGNQLEISLCYSGIAKRRPPKLIFLRLNRLGVPVPTTAKMDEDLITVSPPMFAFKCVIRLEFVYLCYHSMPDGF